MIMTGYSCAWKTDKRLRQKEKSFDVVHRFRSLKKARYIVAYPKYRACTERAIIFHLNQRFSLTFCLPFELFILQCSLSFLHCL